MFTLLALPRPQTVFLTEVANGRITSLRATRDRNQTDYIAANAALGEVRIWTRKKPGAWHLGEETKSTNDLDGQGRRWRAGDLDVHSWFEKKGERLLWRIQLRNPTSTPVEIGGLGTPLPMRTRSANDTKPTVLKHSFISGAGSFLFWMRPDSQGPYLTMTGLKGTSLEYWNRNAGTYQVFAHSASEAPVIKEKKGSWRLPHTSRTLKPGESVEYGYAFEWSKDYGAVRDTLARNGKLDVQVAPGMTVPSDLYADVAFRSDIPVAAVEAEHPRETQIRFVTTRNGYRIYRVKFRRLGENRLTVRQAGGAKTYLEFFACQPVETLIKKRAAFLTRSQIKGTGKWYDGLLAEWNMDSQVQLSPDNYDRIKGWRIYEVTCDDPGLGKPAYLATKNAEYPVQAEVTALDDYIEKFVWGGLQQTPGEKYPYGIYGIPDWKTLRESKLEDRTKGVDHVWRPYDYPHIALMYRSMYRIARQHPEIKTRLTADEYLRRAYGTANAMFTVPMKVIKWSAYETGFYNEVAIPALIEDLKGEGMMTEARQLQAHWEKKVKTFVAGRVDLFGSEYAFDSTGFESTQALADYAIRNGKRLGLTASQSNRFLETQHAANVFCRGSIEPAYYTLGSDYRGSAGDGYTLSYMSQMGGGSILNYGLDYAKDPASYLRLGYQSYLSSWALMNAGTSESNFGYWYPGRANDGAAGGGFEPASSGETWLGQPHGRGSWYYSCEIDLGFTGALRAARTVVTDDPIFGRFCYGGEGTQHGETYTVTAKDGVRRRLSLRTHSITADFELDGTRFDRQFLLREAKGRMDFWVEPTKTDNSTLAFKIPGNPNPLVLLNAKPIVGIRQGGTMVYKLGRSDRHRLVSVRVRTTRKPM